jgi:hypothetical protein
MNVLVLGLVHHSIVYKDMVMMDKTAVVAELQAVVS